MTGMVPGLVAILVTDLARYRLLNDVIEDVKFQNPEMAGRERYKGLVRPA